MAVQTKTPKAKAILSGWCGPTAAEWSHQRCAGGYGGYPCRCACHTAEPAPPPPLGESWPVHRLTWIEPGGELKESGPSQTGREWQVAAVPIMRARGCTDVRLYEGTAVVTEWNEVDL